MYSYKLSVLQTKVCGVCVVSRVPAVKPEAASPSSVTHSNGLHRRRRRPVEKVV